MTLTTAGWAAAALASLLALFAWRVLAVRAEAVARACHELRGPIAAARLGIELGIRSGELATQRLRAIDLELGRAGLALRDLDRAVGHARLDRFEHCERLDAYRLLEDSVEAWRASAAAIGSSIELERSGGPALVLGDRLRLAQATGNLIANAIEHGGGPVRVICGSRGSSVRIELQDSGPGLPAPVAELARGSRRARNGRGRGLAIASSIVQAHGGRIAAAPSERGARLVIELPASFPDAAAQTPGA